MINDFPARIISVAALLTARSAQTQRRRPQAAPIAMFDRLDSINLRIGYETAGEGARFTIMQAAALRDHATLDQMIEGVVLQFDDRIGLGRRATKLGAAYRCIFAVAVAGAEFAVLIATAALGHHAGIGFGRLAHRRCRRCADR